MTGSKVNDAVEAHSDAAEWDTLLRAAYEGEIIGEARYASLEQLASTSSQRRAARLLVELEKETGDILLPVMHRHNISFDRDVAWAKGEAFTNATFKEGWVAYFEKVAPLAEVALTDMKKLHKMSDEIDRAATGRLVAHEEAFLEFVRREVAGESHSAAPLEEYLDNQRRVADPSLIWP